MKNNILYILLLLFIVASCKKTEDPVLRDVDERLNEQIDAYQKQLEGSPFGWIGYILTDSERVESFKFKFNNVNRVVMSSTYKTADAESSYRIKAIQRPTLLFDTYSTIHLLADPTSSVFQGATGSGFRSDFEFEFISSNPDTIKLEGTFNKSKLILVRATSAEDFNGSFNATNEMEKTINNLKTYFKRANIKGLETEVKLDAGGKSLMFSYLDGEEMKSVSSKFYVSGNNIFLFNPIELGGETIVSLEGITYDASTGFIKGSINGSAIEIKEAIEPLKLDKDAAKLWYDQLATNFNNCWVSDMAFHADGVDDFCKFRSIPNFVNLWYAGPAVFGPGVEGLIAFTGSFPGVFTATEIPPVIQDGIMTVKLRGTSGNFTSNTPDAVAMRSARLIFYGGATAGSTEKWYIIPTASRRFDMVRVSDALAWISWRPR